ncbi:hypothetical protein L1277_001777 [Okibacterium sp. HSC-33S16]|uniref:DUF2304 domain-containing protein n=1 Tax=Okibacterium sp. HSC-33S16 TaxID=2910965 RepID=UPI0020A1AB75|nr:DUF2304 domain-containing protein [Okibacterium sp. HSC-33S16]MCP2031679.1 hypothetical protein [Okibacterium sp. HSC-33S16]
MDNQIIIKIALIAALAIFAVFLMLPGSGARHLALRRLSMIGLFAVAVVAVVFPQLINEIANAVGVGRGTDLLLYGLIVVFIGNSLAASRRNRHMERELTQLARAVALADAPGHTGRGSERR